jgi:hypothetical protein
MVAYSHHFGGFAVGGVDISGGLAGGAFHLHPLLIGTGSLGTGSQKADFQIPIFLNLLKINIFKNRYQENWYRCRAKTKILRTGTGWVVGGTARTVRELGRCRRGVSRYFL